MTKYLVARTATRNLSINGRTLYLVEAGWWTLDRENAREFNSKSEAQEQCVKDLEGCRAVEK